jgi:PleD family two-component response regulator
MECIISPERRQDAALAWMPPLRAARMEKPFALIIEDDRDLAALFRHVLDIAGYHTEIVMQGREALERLKSAQPDIMLLNLSLPDVPGAKIMEWMRGVQRLKDVPVVVLSPQARMAESLPVEPDLVLLKPVNLGQLSNLVQRLRHSALSMNETPWDAVTHLYNRQFFSLRLSYSLDHARQVQTNRFGVLFVELEPYTKLREHTEPEQLNILLREIAGHLKTSLRPTDTVSRFDEAVFLILLEDIPDYSVPASIAARIELDLVNLISERKPMEGLRTNVGLVLCGAEYGNVDEILADVELARKHSATPNARVNYDREMLMQMRGNGS